MTNHRAFPIVHQQTLEVISFTHHFNSVNFFKVTDYILLLKLHSVVVFKSLFSHRKAVYESAYSYMEECID